MGKPMDRSGRWLSSPVDSFEKAYPTLEAASIEYYETGDGVFRFDDGPSRYCQPRPLREGLLRCSNPLCRRGGYEIDLKVGRMVSEGKEREELVMYCPGDEGSLKGRRVGRRCRNVLHVRLTLRYKSTVGGDSTESA